MSGRLVRRCFGSRVNDCLCTLSFALFGIKSIMHNQRDNSMASCLFAFCFLASKPFVELCITFGELVLYDLREVLITGLGLKD